MARRHKRLQCGGYVREALYNVPEPRDTPVVRRERSKLTSEAQKKVNLDNSKVKLAMLIGGNFGPGDLLVTPTFAPEHLPATFAEVQKKIRRYYDTLRMVRGKQGHEAIYIYAPHHSETVRWHFHYIINSTGPEDWETLKSLWPWGDVHITRLKAEELSTPEALAGYLIGGRTDEPKWSDRPNSARAWCCSTNLKKIVVTTSWEHDSTARLELPEGCDFCEGESRFTPFGSYEYISYFRRGGVQDYGVPQPDSLELIDRGLL